MIHIKQRHFLNSRQHTLNRSCCFRVGYQMGFSLIELMIGIVISLIISIALISLFLNINRTNTEMAKTNSQIENGRFALQLLQTDIEHAGFWGGHIPQFDDLAASGVPSDTPAALPNPCLAYATPWTASGVQGLIGVPVQVYGATPPSGTGCVTNLATNKKGGTDVLVVRHAETCLAGSGGNCPAFIEGEVYFQDSSCEAEKATPYILGAASAVFTLHDRSCGTVAEVRKFISNIYYIRDYASTVGDGIPTLMLSQFETVGGVSAQQAATPLIEGIEGFHVELGIDNLSDSAAAVNYASAVVWADPLNLVSPTNRGDGSTDGASVSCTDVSPCTVAQLINTVVVKLYVLARNNSESPGYTDTKTYALGGTTLGPYDDGFKRHVFSTAVRLNNISGRRETP